MENTENQIPPEKEDVESSPSPEETITISKEQFESLTAKVDEFSTKLDAYQKAQKQLNNIVQESVASKIEPTFTWLEEEIRNCNFNSDLPVSAENPLDPDVCGKQYATWYFSDVIEQTKSIEEAKKSAVNVMNDIMKSIRK